MSEIARTGKWNPGGGRWLEVVPAAGVAGYARPTPTSVPVITLKPGFAWNRIYTTPGTLQYREDADTTDNGRTYEYTIRGFSPDDNAAKRQALDSLLIYERMLVRFCDNAGLVRIAGTPVESLTFAYELGTDADVPGSRGYDLTLKGTTTQRAAYA